MSCFKILFFIRICSPMTILEPILFSLRLRFAQTLPATWMAQKTLSWNSLAATLASILGYDGVNLQFSGYFWGKRTPPSEFLTTQSVVASRQHLGNWDGIKIKFSGKTTKQQSLTRRTSSIFKPYAKTD